MKVTDSCVVCGKSWEAEPIPEEYREMYSEGTTHYSRLIGVSYDDRVQYWMCPFCGATYHRGDMEKVGGLRTFDVRGE